MLNLTSALILIEREGPMRGVEIESMQHALEYIGEQSSKEYVTACQLLDIGKSVYVMTAPTYREMLIQEAPLVFIEWLNKTITVNGREATFRQPCGIFIPDIGKNKSAMQRQLEMITFCERAYEQHKVHLLAVMEAPQYAVGALLEIMYKDTLPKEDAAAFADNTIELGDDQVYRVIKAPRRMFDSIEACMCVGTITHMTKYLLGNTAEIEYLEKLFGQSIGERTFDYVQVVARD